MTVGYWVIRIAVKQSLAKPDGLMRVGNGMGTDWKMQPWFFY
jgi:hypothetical protein